MVSRKYFGQTWWGNAWVEAITKIDYNTNRLPRGRTYANTGKVLNVQLREGIVEAKVKGRRAKPYQIAITLKKFNNEEIEKIQSCICEDPYLASELAMGKLPGELLSRLSQNSIFLLPTSWHDFEAKCSCPDWANPCKHIAAVYYLIANEVDKNPFILFHLRGIETNTLMLAAGFAESLPTTDEIKENFIPFDQTNPTAKMNKSDDEIEAELTSILDSLSQEKDNKPIFNLLDESPLFYSRGNFKKILLKAYQNIAKNVEKLQLLENYPHWLASNIILLDPENKKEQPLPATSFFIFSEKNALQDLDGLLKKIVIPEEIDGKLILKRKTGWLSPAETVIDYFIKLPLQITLDKTSSGARLLSIATTIALALAKTSLFLPQIKSDLEGHFFIYYTPLKQLKITQKIIDFLTELTPPNFFYHRKEKSLLFRPLAAESLLSLILTRIVHLFSGIKELDKLCNVFFGGTYYQAQKFNEKQTARVIHYWLSILNLGNNDFTSVITIKIPVMEKRKTFFQLQVEILNKKDPLSPLLPLQKLFTIKNNVFSQPVSKVRLSIAKQISMASSYFPPLKTVLRSKGKELSLINPLEMSKLIKNGQYILNMLGMHIVLPKELKVISSPKLSLKAKLKGKKKQGVSYLNLKDILSFSWEVALGNNRLSQEEFLKLVQSASGVVKFKDHFLLLQPEEVAKIINKINEPIPELSSSEILKAALTGETDHATLFQTDQKLQKIIRELSSFKHIKIPSTLKAVLRPYQIRGFQWLYSNTNKGLGSCLADDMGLGKTVQAICLILKIIEEKELHHPALVICPTTLIGNWLKECQKFAPSLNILTYHGTKRQLTTNSADLVITTYGLIRRESGKFQKRKWGLVIIDEAQNIKNADSKQSRAVKALKSGASIALSGTPVENRLSELWSIFDYLNPAYLGSQANFIRRFAIPIEKYRDHKKIDLLKKATAPFMMRRMKTDRSIIKDLPDKIVKNEYCYLTKEQTALYQQIVNANMPNISEAEGIARRGLIFSLITSLKQICNHPVHYTKKGTVLRQHSGKSEITISLLEKITSLREKVLLFTQYKEMGNLLTQLIQNEFQFEPYFFHGSLTRKKREMIIEDFQSNHHSPVMIISLKAGGTGLNLTAATNVIHYDLWWNPAVEDQATDRTYRIGQTKKVMVHRLITIGTFEEKIDEMIKAKKELSNLIVSGGERWLSELSNQELKEIFKLG